jgi:phosphatidylserine synthase
LNDTWTHAAARWMIRPLVGTGVTPNHLTTLRLLTGIAACIGIALGTPAGNAWGGALWLVSAFLDRADGELARVGNMMSAAAVCSTLMAGVILARYLGLKRRLRLTAAPAIG